MATSMILYCWEQPDCTVWCYVRCVCVCTVCTVWGCVCLCVCTVCVLYEVMWGVCVLCVCTMWGCVRYVCVYCVMMCEVRVWGVIVWCAAFCQEKCTTVALSIVVIVVSHSLVQCNYSILMPRNVLITAFNSPVNARIRFLLLETLVLCSHTYNQSMNQSIWFYSNINSQWSEDWINKWCWRQSWLNRLPRTITS